MFDPIKASQNIKDEFISYISTSFHLADKEYAKQFEEELNKTGTIAKGPYLDISDAFESGKNIKELIDEGQVSPLFNELERNLNESDKEIKLERSLYKHQEKAIRKINANKNIVVTTGTGSGKTECFILPILNELLKEKEEGTLSDGVRAILIYPMNALANDQMKRLRAILKDYKDITFGVYNSSTQQNDEDGIREYGKIFKDKDGTALKPLKNEIISRNAMQLHPPHILVTNYAMLEYMMLRPNDDLVFSGAKLRFLVLDEAHIYKGATGIETSLLLRRVKARISNPSKVHHILTSATLGGKEADDDIVSFANTLCDAVFETDDIIRSKTVMPSMPEKSEELPLGLFTDLAHPKTSMDVILDKYNVQYDRGKSDEENLFDICVSSSVYRVLRECAVRPMTVHEIASTMRNIMNISDSELVDFIFVASKAEKNKTSLIKARYHMFVRALEGAYITLCKDKQLFLTRKNYVGKSDEQYKVFEAAVCDDCGRLAIVGKTKSNRLEQTSNRSEEEEVYLICNKGEKEYFDDDDSILNNEIGKNDYLICSVCGEIHHKSQMCDFKCGHGASNLVEVRKAERKGVRNENKCPCCNFGHMKRFYVGYDAATAVLGTELFEQLPESEEKLEIKANNEFDEMNLFAIDDEGEENVEIIKKKRQFLSFSDSRSEAAFYACYMTKFYEEFLRRRGIWHVINKNKENISRHPWEIETLVDELTSYFNANRTFAKPGDKGTENLSAISKRQAWIAVLNEMVNSRRTTSLVSLGIVDFVYKGNTEKMMGGVAKKYNRNVEDITALFNLLVMDIVHGGAIEAEDCTFTDDEREYIYFAAQPRRFTKIKEKDIEKTKYYLSGWTPRKLESGKFLKNGRLRRVVKMLETSEEDAVDLLNMYWEYVLVKNQNSLTADGNGEYYFSTDKFLVTAGTEERPIYVCDKCGKTTMTNCMNSCVSIKCDGHLKQVSHESLIENNHYAKLYSEELMSPLHIKEHTGQLGRKEQQEYQEMFVNKDINALSCSTTFEMGVDVGDLETVYLRNMPPSPANYVQRAGRAGRSVHSAAYSLTYSKLSSHDFTYFEHPERMISGKIGVPVFTISNKKIIMRHIFAVALSDFFALHPEVYNSNNADVLLNGNGYEAFVDFIESKPSKLLDILKKSIPVNMHKEMGITDWSWTELLIGENGILEVAVLDFRNTVKWYENEVSKLDSSGDIGAASKYLMDLKSFRKSKDDGHGRNELIEFLVRNNVLPKYGFPVDTVELYQGNNVNDDKKLQMIRDLQLAVAEYAPDAQVVADGKLYTSRYIRKLPQTTGQEWKEIYVAKCKNDSCQTWNQRDTEPSSDGEKCVSCGNIIERANWMKAIEPRKGFVAESTPKEVPLKKPERSYRGEDVYIGDPLRQVMYKKTFEVSNGERFQMETSANDSLMVVCNDVFFVCNRCGYAVSAKSKKDEKDFSKYAMTYTKTHKSPWGKECKSTLKRKLLCHTFKTDVVRITFSSERAKNQATMLSVMYALLEAVSEILDIERTDIKGCLHRINYGRSLIYEVVLYDAVAGGAGHVRRLVSDDCATFKNVINKAIDITENCTCDSSCYNCLRNYYNQTVHDLLDRKEACSFLKNYIGDIKNIPDDEFEKKYETVDTSEKNMFKAENTVFSDGYPCFAYQNWNELGFFIPQEYIYSLELFEEKNIPMPSKVFANISKIGHEPCSQALLIWEEEKVLVFSTEYDKIDIQGWKSFYINEINSNEFAQAFVRED